MTGVGNCLPCGAHLARLVCVLSLAAFALGCGEGQGFVPVSGKVTIDGEPVTNGYVRFFPASGRQSGGSLNEQGEFSLSTYEPGDGAVPGEYRIAVVAQEPLGGSRFRWYAPKHYANPATSELSESVEGATDSIQIELSWGKRKGPFVESL